MTDSLQSLIEQIQKASPIIWEAAVRQVRVETYELAFFAVLLPVVVGVGLRYALKVPKDRFGDVEGRGLAAYIISAAAGLIWLPVTATLVEYLCNPTFAAIKELKGLL